MNPVKDPGFEYLDDTPVEIPMRLRKKDSFTEMVQHVAEELSRRASEKGGETLEDMLDFDDDEDELPLAHAEIRYMKEEELLQEALEAAKVRRQRFAAMKFKKEHDRGQVEEKGKHAASADGGGDLGSDDDIGSAGLGGGSANGGSGSKTPGAVRRKGPRPG